MNELIENLDNIPENSKNAIIFFTKILKKLSSELVNVKENIVPAPAEDANDSSVINADLEVFLLCESQITKCSRLMVDVFKREIEFCTVLQESRAWIMERLKWCLDRLNLFLQNLDTVNINNDDNLENNFIYWVDGSLTYIETFEKLFLESWNAEKYKCTESESWKEQCLEEMKNICNSFKELICAAMNICQYCTEMDKKIITARCHVILREARNLIMEMLNDKNVANNLDILDFKTDDLKNDLHFPTITLFLNILKESVCNLEACINKAILRLVFQSLVRPEDPLIDLKNAIISHKDGDINNINEIKDFDFHTEKLTLIGLFAISCSADKQRVSSLKSCIASLESIEPQLVPSMLLDVNNPHCDIIMKHWLSEISLLRMIVFLIIDHTAFLEMAVEQFKSNFNDLSSDKLTVESVQVFIQIGKGVIDYVKVYLDNEPSVFVDLVDIQNIIDDSIRVINECKAASEVLLIKDKKSLSKVSKDEQSNRDARMLKRLKLLFTLISKIYNKINDRSTLDLSDESSSSSSSNREKSPKDVRSKSAEKKGLMNFLQKIAKVGNNKEFKSENSCFSRSTIVRVKNDKTFTNRKIPQSNISDIFNLHFSFLSSGTSASNSCIDKIDEFLLADISMCENAEKSRTNSPKTLPNKTNNRSMFYKDKNRLTRRNDSLRKRLFINQIQVNKSKFVLEVPSKSIVDKLQIDFDDSNEKLNTSLDLQITYILEQLSGLSNTLSLEKLDIEPSEGKSNENLDVNKSQLKENVLRIKVNDSPQKNVVKIKVNDGKENKPAIKTSFMEDCGIDISFGSNIPTPERLNDINNLEKRLNELKMFWKK